MTGLGPFDPARQVAVAVSGGADSMALVHLAQAWGDPLAIVVDHGIRPAAAAEAGLTMDRLRAAAGIAAHLVRLRLPGGGDLGARARAARYDALLDVCRTAGRPDLLLGHHARDQDETVFLRTQGGSGTPGRAGMAAIGWRGPARLLRPLLRIHPARLRATLRARGLSWVEDPGNTDPATARGALRQFPLPPQPGTGPARAAAERGWAAELADAVTLHEAGHARLAAAPSALALSFGAWSALLWTLSGRPYPPGTAAAEALRRRGHGTLHGLELRDGWLFREAAALPPPVPARAGARWDDRFHLADAVDGAELGALGPADTVRLRRHAPWPARVFHGLPVLRQGAKLLAVPHLSYPDPETCRSLRVEFRPARPLAGAPFRP